MTTASAMQAHAASANVPWPAAPPSALLEAPAPAQASGCFAAMSLAEAAMTESRRCAATLAADVSPSFECDGAIESLITRQMLSTAALAFATSFSLTCSPCRCCWSNINASALAPASARCKLPARRVLSLAPSRKARHTHAAAHRRRSRRRTPTAAPAARPPVLELPVPPTTLPSAMPSVASAMVVALVVVSRTRTGGEAEVGAAATEEGL